MPINSLQGASIQRFNIEIHRVYCFIDPESKELTFFLSWILKEVLVEALDLDLLLVGQALVLNAFFILVTVRRLFSFVLVKSWSGVNRWQMRRWNHKVVQLVDS